MVGNLVCWGTDGGVMGAQIQCDAGGEEGLGMDLTLFLCGVGSEGHDRAPTSLTNDVDGNLCDRFHSLCQNFEESLPPTEAVPESEVADNEEEMVDDEGMYSEVSGKRELMISRVEGLTLAYGWNLNWHDILKPGSLLPFMSSK
ncbi:hypothetical protein F5141DRAFT_1067338 [Pisolithus sp. B1]|nr:hypothetical protein F5141DRAFT_1067338 [Pisolithus sp. B1]